MVDRRRGRQPLVPQQPDLPRADHRAAPVRLLRAQRRRHEPLRRPGEARGDRPLGRHRLRPRLGQAGPPAAGAHLALHQQRPVALRGRLHGLRRAVPPSRALGRKATRSTWRRSRPNWAGCRFYPQFNRNSLELVARRPRRPAHARTERSAAGSSRSSRRRRCASRSRTPTRRRTGRASGSSGAAMPSCPAPRATSSSCGTTWARTATPSPRSTAQRRRRDGAGAARPAPRGKMDLVVDLNFRMDTSALYSDIVLPAATWYEKNDLNSTDLHSFIHPLGSGRAARHGSREVRLGDLQDAGPEGQRPGPPAIFPTPFRDVVTLPLDARYARRDGPATRSLDWKRGECEPIPGKTMPHMRVVERDYAEPAQALHLVRPAVARRTASAANGSRSRSGTSTTNCSTSPMGGSPTRATCAASSGTAKLPQPRGRAGRG